MFPIRWPISSIRRYGCDDNQFSFESGRCAPTGSGIFAFKVDRGPDLINMLRQNIEKAGLNDRMDLFQDSPTRNQNNRLTNNNNLRTVAKTKKKSVNSSTMTNTDDHNLVEYTVGPRRPCQQLTDNPIQTTMKRDNAATNDPPACDKLTSKQYNNTKDASTSTDDATINDTVVNNNIPQQEKSSQKQLKEDTQPTTSSYAVIDFESTKALEVSAASHAAERQEVSK